LTSLLTRFVYGDLLWQSMQIDGAFQVAPRSCPIPLGGKQEVTCVAALVDCGTRVFAGRRGMHGDGHAALAWRHDPGDRRKDLRVLRAPVRYHRHHDQDAPVSGTTLPTALLARMAKEIGNVCCFKIESAKALMKAGGIIACEDPRHPFPAMHPEVRKGLLATAQRLDPLVLRWGR
jgi:hypothetical protein